MTRKIATVHLAEERWMVATAISNYITSFIMVGAFTLCLVIMSVYADQFSIAVTLMFCLGDVDAALGSPTGQPCIAVVLNATNSIAAAKVLTVVVLILVVSCSINGVTTNSRQLW